LTPDAVALEARKAADTEDPMTTATAVEGDTSAASGITSLTQRRLSHLPADTRPLPSVAVYDQLLRRHRGEREGTSNP
ncbi:MAG TPA: hypothetical protein VF821_12875, partial [Lentzea sp.]